MMLLLNILLLYGSTQTKSLQTAGQGELVQIPGLHLHQMWLLVTNVYKDILKIMCFLSSLRPERN